MLHQELETASQYVLVVVIVFLLRYCANDKAI